MTSDNIIPYTHWAYFLSKESAERCTGDLADYVTRIDPPIPGSDRWLLRAGRDVAIHDLEQRHDEVRRIVARHGGTYDGGEAAYLATEEGLIPTADPTLINPTNPRGETS